MRKQWIIKGKGYFNTTVNDYATGLEFCDLKSSYGQIEFTGTEHQVDKFVESLLENEETFKYINHHLKGEEQEMFFNGVNFEELIS